MRTFVIGFGGSEGIVLDQIAEAGGTQRAFSLSDSANVTNDLLAALKAIRLGTTP